MTTMKLAAIALGLFLFSSSEGIAGETGKELPLPLETRQELDRTMNWLKSAIESINIVLTPIEPEIGTQYYSHYSFENEGCSVTFSYEFNYYERISQSRKTTRLGASFNLKDIGVPDAAPFNLTHIETHLYSVSGNSFRIPVKNADFAEKIADKINLARRLCSGSEEKKK
jgi:hypothetical protein